MFLVLVSKNRPASFVVRQTVCVSRAGLSSCFSCGEADCVCSSCWSLKIVLLLL